MHKILKIAIFTCVCDILLYAGLFAVFFSCSVMHRYEIRGVCKSVSFFLTEDIITNKGVVTYYGSLFSETHAPIRMSSKNRKLVEDMSYAVQVVDLFVPSAGRHTLCNNTFKSEEKFSSQISIKRIQLSLQSAGTILLFPISAELLLWSITPFILKTRKVSLYG